MAVTKSVVSNVTTSLAQPEWPPAGASLALDFKAGLYWRNGTQIDVSEFTANNALDITADGLLVDGDQFVWLDVSMLTLTPAATVVFTGTGGASVNASARIWSLSTIGSLGTDYVFAQLFTTATKIASRYKANNGSQIAPASVDWAKEVKFTHATSWDATDIRHSMNDGTPVVAATGTALNADKLDRLYIGSNFGGTTPLDGRVESIVIYPVKTQ